MIKKLPRDIPMQDIDVTDDELKSLMKAAGVLREKKIISYDEETNTLTVNLDMKVKFKGNLNIDCDKHVVINSGQDLDLNRNDVAKYSIWLNPELDENEKPMKYASKPTELNDG